MDYLEQFLREVAHNVFTAYIKRQPVIRQGNLIIDPQCCTVFLESEDVNLFPKEFDVLLLLAQYPGWVLSTEQIYEAV